MMNPIHGDAMQIQVKTLSPLEKVFCRPELNADEITRISGLRGETVSFQIAVCTDLRAEAACRVRSETELNVTVRGDSDSELNGLWFQRNGFLHHSPYFVFSVFGCHLPPVFQNQFIILSRCRVFQIRQGGDADMVFSVFDSIRKDQVSSAEFFSIESQAVK